MKNFSQNWVFFGFKKFKLSQISGKIFVKLLKICFLSSGSHGIFLLKFEFMFTLSSLSFSFSPSEEL
jgi:hypothetical protein